MEPSHDITLRTASESDSRRIAALHAASWRSAYRGILTGAYLDRFVDDERAQVWQERLRPQTVVERQYVQMAERARELVGFVCVLLDEDPVWGACLDNLHVRSDHQGRGLGRRLFAHATEWVARTEPGWALHLWVLEANQPARSFYDRYQ